jgi:hypothetical protein
VAAVPKEYQEIERAAKRVSEKAKYPIRNFKQLADAFGGEDATIEFEGQGRKLGQVKKLIPDEFFPVESEEDLIAKGSYLYQRFRPVEDAHTPAEKKDSPPDESPEPDFPKEEKPRPGGFPAIRGRKKQD